MKAVVASCRPGTWDKVDIYGNPVEPGNEIPIERKGPIGRDAGSMELMPIDVVNGGWALEQGMDMGSGDGGDFVKGRISSGRHPEKMPPNYQHWFDRELGVGEMHPGLRRGLGMAAVLKGLGIL